MVVRFTIPVKIDWGMEMPDVFLSGGQCNFFVYKKIILFYCIPDLCHQYFYDKCVCRCYEKLANMLPRSRAKHILRLFTTGLSTTEV